jgi:hypothetical protein
MRTVKLSLCLIYLFLSHYCFAQIEFESIFHDEGFEQVNLIPSEEQGKYILVFEHRGKRNQFDALYLAKKIVEEYSINVKSYIPLSFGQPMGHYQEDSVSFRVLNLPDYLKRDVKSVFLTEKYRLDIRLQPDIQTRLGYFERPFQTKINMILDTRFVLGKGISFYTGMLIPIQNNLDSQKLNLRLAPTMFNFFFEPVDDHFSSISIGTFYNDRYGFDLQYRYRDPSYRWSAGVEYGITGYYFMPSTGIFIKPLDDEILLVDVEVFLPKGFLTLKLAGGQFIFEDRGFRLDIIKQYGRVDMGLFGARTSNGTNIGINITAPIFPGKLIRTNGLEFRTTEEFKHEYFFNHNGSIARRYRTAFRLANHLRKYNQRFISNQKYYSTR